MELTERDIARFWSHVDKSDECWLWTGYCSKTGYGQFGLGDRILKAHRVSYEITYGDVPPKSYVCHHCDNPSCVRPSHLFCGTQFDNMQDMASKHRGMLQQHPELRQGERHPLAKLTDEQVRQIRQSSGISQDKLAKQFGVSRRMIRRILSRLAWKHVK